MAAGPTMKRLDASSGAPAYALARKSSVASPGCMTSLSYTENVGSLTTTTDTLTTAMLQSRRRSGRTPAPAPGTRTRRIRSMPLCARMTLTLQPSHTSRQRKDCVPTLISPTTSNRNHLALGETSLTYYRYITMMTSKGHEFGKTEVPASSEDGEEDGEGPRDEKKGRKDERKPEIEPLAPVDHSTIKYLEVEKNFYEEHPDISKLTEAEVRRAHVSHLSISLLKPRSRTFDVATRSASMGRRLLVRAFRSVTWALTARSSRRSANTAIASQRASSARPSPSHCAAETSSGSPRPDRAKPPVQVTVLISHRWFG